MKKITARPWNSNTMLSEHDYKYAAFCVNNHERLVEALRDCEEVLSYVARKSGLTHSDAEGVAIEARTLLAQLQADKGEMG